MKIKNYILLVCCVLLTVFCIYLLVDKSNSSARTYDVVNENYARMVGSLERTCARGSLTLSDVSELKTSVDILCGQLRLLYHAEAVRNYTDMAYAYNMYIRFSAYLHENVDVFLGEEAHSASLYDTLDSLYQLLKSEDDVLDAAKLLENVVF